MMCASSLSFIASSGIVYMIGKSLKTSSSRPAGADAAEQQYHQDLAPYRRLIFGLSFADIIQSASILIAPFSPPKGAPRSPWAVGNVGTCDAQGLFTYMGNLGVPLYTLALCIYYLCKVKYRMSGDVFTRRIELKMHAFIILYVCIAGLATVITKSINVIPTGSYCHVSSIPAGCRSNSSYECARGLKAAPFVYLFLSSMYVCLIGVVCTMAMMCWHVLFREPLLYGLRRPTSELNQPENQSRLGKPCGSLCSCLKLFQDRQEYETEGAYLARVYLGQVVSQGCLYVGAYMATYCMAWVHNAYFLTGNRPPYWTSICMSFFLPFGGVFNILVYTRPKVKVLRIRHPEYSWVRAFILVFKAGGEMPKEEQESEDSSNGVENNSFNDIDILVCCCGLFRINTSGISRFSSLGNHDPYIGRMGASRLYSSDRKKESSNFLAYIGSAQSESSENIKDDAENPNTCGKSTPLHYQLPPSPPMYTNHASENPQPLLRGNRELFGLSDSGSLDSETQQG